MYLNTSAEQLEKYFEEYYQKNKNAIRVYKEDFSDGDFDMLENSFDILNTDRRFYKLSNRTFGLLKWLLEELERYIINGIKVDLDLIEYIAQKVFGFSSVNREKLRQIFNFQDGYLTLEKLNSISEKYKIGTIKTKQKFNSVEDYLRNINFSLLLSEILSELKLSGFTKNDILIELNTSSHIHLDNEGRYCYSVEDKTIECLFHNIINVHEFAGNISLNCIIKAILNYKNDPMTTIEIIEELKIIGQFDSDNILSILRNSNEFIEIEEDIWVPFKWRNYSIKNLLRNPKDIHEIMLIRGIGLDSLKSLAIYLNLLDLIHINDKGKYFYSEANKTQECLIDNISNLIGVINDTSLKDITINIFSEVNNPLSLSNLYENISIIRDVSIDEILNVLDNDEFKQIGYNIWALSNWNKYQNFELDFNSTISQIRNCLKDKEWECFIKYNIDAKRYTLEDIGQDMGVTRERVRQIIAKATNKLKHYSNKSKIRPYIECLKALISVNKVMLVDELKENQRFLKAFGNQPVDYIIALTRFWGSNYSIIKGKYITEIKESFITKYLDQIACTLPEKKIKIIKMCDLAKVLNIECKLGEQLISDFIRDDSRYVIIKDGITVLYSNSRITKANMIHMALSSIGTPVHHSIIRKEYYRLFDENISIRNILSTLDREEQFVRVYIGTYGLQEWNCQKHINAIDLAIEALDKCNRVLYYDKIWELIKERTKSKDTTLYAFLNSDERIIGLGEGLYGLSKWLNDSNCREKYGFSREQVVLTRNIERVLIDTSKNDHGHMVTKYRISEHTLKNCCIKLDKVIQDYVSERISMYDFEGNIYHLTYSLYSGYLFRLTSFFKSKKTVPGQILYFEFVVPNAMRILTEQEYEHKYIPFNHLIVPEEELGDFEPELEEEINIVGLETLRQFGLKFGFVYNEDIEKIDITSEYQSTTELILDFMGMGIEFLDR